MILPQSPFLSKLRTDFLPSPAEKLEVHQLISTRKERLQAIEDEIAQLRAEQDEIRRFIDDHLALISPIRQVHADILRGIFNKCIPESGFPACSARDAPLLLTEVCRLWREVAISTPTLWNRIHIGLPTLGHLPTTDKFCSYMHLWRDGIQTWLQRSGTVPLVLSISGAVDWDMEEETARRFHGDVARQLLPYASRWKSLSLSVPDRIWTALTESTVELTSLEELKSRHPHSDEDYDNSLKAVLQRAPSLHKLKLEQLYPDLPVRWNCMTEIVLRPSSWPRDRLITAEAIQLLSSSCSSLRHFTVCIYVATQDPLDTFSPVILPNLQTLNIDAEGPSPTTDSFWAPLQHFLDHVTSPKLVDFGLRFPHPHRRTMPLITLVGFLARSGCALRSLVLDVPAAGAELVALLASMPSLTQLKLVAAGELVPGTSDSDWHLPGLLIDSLTPSPSNIDVLCSDLEFLVFRRCRSFVAGPILALAEARCTEKSSTRKLKRLQVGFDDIIDDAKVSLELDALRNRGVLVQFSALSEQPYAKIVATSPKPDFCDYAHSAELWWPEYPSQAFH
ncbi:hypothetical protein VNI00_008557 [Paramarasmius palmivorus]|uniref:F-box domain-containing protein n=1 Tax=Paramarasmius palmivorus TaxID=297713 RepID=A0AAW0CTK1_9AGAR